MFKYLFLVQVLLANELYSWEHHFIEQDLERSLNTCSDIPVHDRPNITISYFPQKLDHFDPRDSRRWLQPYFISEDFYRPGGPIFLMTSPLLRGAWREYAKEFGALCVTLETRYYGFSWATNDVSTENLKYLNSQQQLADVANFITNKDWWFRKDTNKVIVFGGPYGGSIAAYLRLKYPHLVDGTVASSARLENDVAYPAGRMSVDLPTFHENMERIVDSICIHDSYPVVITNYYIIAAEALGNNSEDCAGGVKDAFKELNIQLDQQDGQKQIKELFKFCPTRHEPEISPDDISYLNHILAQIVSFFELYRNASVCTTMTNQTIGTPLDRLASFVHNLLQNRCLPYKYVDMINYLSNPDGYYHIYGDRQIQYQLCTERGNFPINDPSHVFGDRFSYAYYNKICTDVFGSDYNLAALSTTIANKKLDYGGKNINVTNVVFVQGSKDPWLSLGIVKDVNSKSPAIVIKGEFEFADMWTPKENDSAELKEARKRIASNIGTWLKE